MTSAVVTDGVTAADIIGTADELNAEARPAKALVTEASLVLLERARRSYIWQTTARIPSPAKPLAAGPNSTLRQRRVPRLRSQLHRPGRCHRRRAARTAPAMPCRRHRASGRREIALRFVACQWLKWCRPEVELLAG
jgi:hypothetical protein